MLWKYLVLMLLSMVKFLVTPFIGSAFDPPSFLYTFLSVFIGGLISSTIFYFLGSYLLNKNLERKIRKNIVKKKFTRRNKIIIKLKNKVGIWGLAIGTATFLSIPLGTLLLSKFYRHKKTTIFILYFNLLFFAFFLTFIAFKINYKRIFDLFG